MNPPPVRTSQIAEFCRHNGIRRLALFGSALNGRFHEHSDIDLLVEFAPGVRVGYLGMARMERELSTCFGGRTEDLRTAAELSPHFRDEVLAAARVKYDAG